MKTLIRLAAISLASTVLVALPAATANSTTKSETITTSLPAQNNQDQRITLSNNAPEKIAKFQGPLRVLQSNPRYFTDRSGKAIYLTGTHTWNNLQDRLEKGFAREFDYNRYLDFLVRHNHNFMRMWTWENATWAPWTTEKMRWLPLPYTRSSVCCAIDGGKKWNLKLFNQAYFDRLRSRVLAAKNKGIYVSIMLFQGPHSYKKFDSSSNVGNPWHGHPFNKANNINGIDGDPNGDNNGIETRNLQNSNMTRLQEAYVKKVIDTVNDLDNVLYEISNEDYDPSTKAWQKHMVDLVHRYQAFKPKQHPVWWSDVGGSVSNSYATQAAAIHAKYDELPNGTADGTKVVICDTDHVFQGSTTVDFTWKNFTRGLNLVSMDQHRDGIGLLANHDFRSKPSDRSQGDTNTYAKKMNLAAMTPKPGLCSTTFCLTHPGKEYLVFQPSSGPFTVTLASGTYAVEWFNPNTHTAFSGRTVTGIGRRLSFKPPFSGKAVLYLKSISLSSPTRAQ